MRGKFSGDPQLKMLYFKEKGIASKYYDGRHAMLLREYWYVDKKGRRYLVPAGFLFNGGSIPRFAWDSIGGPFEFYVPAYIVHDYLCDQAELMNSPELRKLADETFYEMLLVLNCPKAKARIMYLAVRKAA